MKNAIIIIVLCTSLNTFAQQITLKGQVSIHNSKFNTGKLEFVPNTSIKGPFTKPSITDNNGNFQLEFVGISPGTSIQLQAEKMGLEVVNQYDLQDVVISRKSPLRIFLASKGNLAEAQTELYNISKKSLYAKKNALIARLQKDNGDSDKAIKELELYFGYPISDRYEAEKELINKISELEKRLPEFALELAKRNLDFVSEMYIEAYLAFKNGDIEETIKILDSTTLASQYKLGRTNISKGNSLKAVGESLVLEGGQIIEQTIESYVLKANTLFSVFQFNKAAEIYIQLIEIYSENDFEQIRSADIYDKLAVIFFSSGDYQKALSFQQKGIALKEEVLENDDPRLATSYSFIGEIYVKLAEFDKSLKLNLKALHIREKKLDKNHFLLATSYNNLASLYRRIGQFQDAIEHVDKAIAIWDSIESKEVVYGYNVKSLILNEVGKYAEAYDYQLKATSIHEEIYGVDHFNMAAVYNNMAYALNKLGNQEESLKYQKKSIGILEKNLSPNHPDLGVTYFNLSRFFTGLGDFESAKLYINKTIPIFKAAFGDKHPYLANAYGVLAEIHISNGHFEKGIEEQQKLIAIKKAIDKIDELELAKAYYAMGVIYSRAGNYSESLSFHNLALDIRLKKVSPIHPEIGESYYEMTQTHLRFEKYKQALNTLLKAIEIDKANYAVGTTNYRFVAEDYLLLSQLYLQLKNKSQAQQTLTELEKIIQSIDVAKRGNLETNFKALKDEIDKQ